MILASSPKENENYHDDGRQYELRNTTQKTIVLLGSIGEELSLEDAEIAAELMDSDGDGLLSFDDLVKVVESANEEEKEKDLKLAFKMYEEMEGCGCITPKSLKRMLSKLGESRTVDECELMIKKFDLDGNGVLDFQEFQDMMS
ncbi:EF-hand domain pair [Artemisia annua]|uniref:EF-hand domain pair n=1 Tax=Artemisia annua TaxID=35608 RepID=A0A2U1L8E2_ARTAN|nr:EF-hand domain pair [Artemisia annua]